MCVCVCVCEGVCGGRGEQKAVAMQPVMVEANHTNVYVAKRGNPRNGPTQPKTLASVIQTNTTKQQKPHKKEGLGSHKCCHC